MKKYYFLLLFVVTLTTFAQNQQRENYSRLRIYGNHQELHQLENIGFDACSAAFYSDDKGEYIEGDFSQWEIEQIQSLSLNYKVIYKDASDYYKERHKKIRTANLKSNTQNCDGTYTADFPEYAVPNNFSLGTYAGFFTYEEMLAHINQMYALYPNLITQPAPIDTFLTHQDRPIYFQRMAGDFNATKPQMLFTAVHHAREPMSMTQMIFFMWYLLENYGNDEMATYLLDNFDLHFVPCMNPDGYIYNYDNFFYDANGIPDFHFWRKNARDNNNDNEFNGTPDGVDLNRNYSYKWGLNNSGSSGNTASSTYRGPTPFSEPETQAIKYLCESNEFRIAYNYHSYGNLLIFPYGYIANSLTPDSLLFDQIGALYAADNHYRVGTANNTVGYLVNGDSDDWMYADTLNKPKILAFTPEVGEGYHGFYPEQTEIMGLIQETVWMNISAVASLGSFGQLVVPFYDNFTETNDSILVGIEQYGLEDGAFSVAFSSISAGLNLLETSFNTPILKNGESAYTHISYEITPDVLPGAELGIAVAIDNGGLIFRDTIYRLNHTPTFDFEYYSDMNSFTDWTNSTATLGFGLEGTNFTSSPNCFSDSPGANHSSFENNSVLLDIPIDLSIADWAQLSFLTRFDTEYLYDYGQVKAVKTDGTEIPLCGRLTEVLPSLGEPVYTGNQSKWAREIIDLSEFFGDTIQIKFTFTSDGSWNKDGVYFDDLEIKVLHGGGCTDSLACNYDVEAEFDDNTCEYESCTPTVLTNIKVYLEGVYNNGVMTGNLNDVLPMNQPFNVAPYFYDGTETRDSNPSTLNIIDWVLVEMRMGTPSLVEKQTILVEQKAGLLLDNGSIVAPDGNALPFENLIEDQEYYIVVRHRNHLDIISNQPRIAATPMVYDFTLSAAQAFGVAQMKTAIDGKAMMFTGDFTGDGVIQTSDYDFWATNPALLGVYINTDANLDAIVQVTDYDLWFFNKAKLGSVEIQY